MGITQSPGSATRRKLTVIISFLNEGEEVIRTLSSVLEFAGGKVDVIIINDGSGSLYDYEKMLSTYPDIVYVRNDKRLGTSVCRDMGVEMAKTPYFLLLDAHMRFYREDWVDEITRLLDEDDRRILCCQTKVLKKDESGEVVAVRKKKTYGARINFSDDRSLLSTEWIYEPDGVPDSTVMDIPCVLGASYAASKRYWKYLRGYEGLKLYGFEEPYISMKAWLEGGRCQLIKDVEVGHIYRDRFPYRVAPAEPIFNRMRIASVLLPEDLKNRVFESCRVQNEAVFRNVMDQLDKDSEKLAELREYYKVINNRDLSFIFQLNR